MTDHAARVYVPDGVRDDLHAEVRRRMIMAFGGVTSFAARGSWLPDDGEPITEDVTVYESVSQRGVSATESPVRGAAKYLQRHSNEDSVMWEVRPVESHGFE